MILQWTKQIIRQSYMFYVSNRNNRCKDRSPDQMMKRTLPLTLHGLHFLSTTERGEGRPHPYRCYRTDKRRAMGRLGKRMESCSGIPCS